MFKNVKKLLQDVKKCLKTLIFKNVMDRRTDGWTDCPTDQGVELYIWPCFLDPLPYLFVPILAVSLCQLVGWSICPSVHPHTSNILYLRVVWASLPLPNYLQLFGSASGLVVFVLLHMKNPDNYRAGRRTLCERSGCHYLKKK